jgi:hypothetical protein
MTDLTIFTGPGSLAKPATSLRAAVSSAERWLLSDCSGSMARPVTSGHYAPAEEKNRRIDRLRELVYGIRQEGIPFKQIVFGVSTNTGCEVREDIPEPSGSTPIAEAVTLAGEMKAKRIIIISDGEPDDGTRALAVARSLAIPIDTFYVGPEGATGEKFLRDLAAATGGEGMTGDLGKGLAALTDGVRKALLALPEKASIAL